MSKILTPYGGTEKIQTTNDAGISLRAEFLSEFLHSKLACLMPICVKRKADTVSSRLSLEAKN